MYIVVALLSNISNYYNYAIFGLAANFLVSHFITSADPLDGLSKFFATLFLAVLVKPFASIVFGTIGDRIGRSIAIKITSFTSIVAMLIIIFAPSFQAIGYYATILLLISRILVLTTVTAEGDGIRIYITEHLGQARINLASSIVTSMGQIGVLLASLVIFFLHKMHVSLKVAFIIGAVLNLYVIYLRRFLIEPIEFSANRPHLPIAFDKIISFVKNNWQLLLVAILINGCIGGIYSFYIIFINSYASHILLSNNTLLIPISIICYVILSPVSGYLADQFGFFKQGLISITLAMVLCAACILQIVFLGKTFATMLVIQAAIIPFYGVPMQIFLKNYLPIRLTYTIFSLCHSIGSILISTPTLFIVNYIWILSNTLWINFCYIELLLLILIICILYIHKYRLHNISIITSGENIN